MAPIRALGVTLAITSYCGLDAVRQQKFDLKAAVGESDCTCPAAQDRFARDDCFAFLQKQDSSHWDEKVRAKACADVGCCWQPLEHQSNEPWCFVMPECCQEGASYGFDDKGHCRNSGSGDRAATECCRRAQDEKKVLAEKQTESAQEKVLEAEKKVVAEREELANVEPKVDAQREEFHQERAAAVKAPTKEAAAAADKLETEAAELAQKRAEELMEQENAELEAERIRLEAKEAESKRLAAEEAARKAAEALEEKKRYEQEAAKESARIAAEKEEERRRIEEAERQRAEAALQRQTARGTLTVSIQSGSNLPDSDHWFAGSTADAFAVVSLLGSEQKETTKHIKNSANPTWNEQFTFNVEESQRFITIDVYDYDLFADSRVLWGMLDRHDHLGTVKVDFREIEAGKVVAFTKHLPTNSAAPSVSFSVKWEPVGLS